MICSLGVTLHHHQFIITMLTNEQMEKLWLKYQREGIGKNLSMQAFCSIHNVPYNQFEKYLKLRRNLSEVHSVTVTGLPGAGETGVCSVGMAGTAASGDSPTQPDSNRIMVTIRMTNGIQITRRNMDYRELRSLVEKLEVLC